MKLDAHLPSDRRHRAAIWIVLRDVPAPVEQVTSLRAQVYLTNLERMWQQLPNAQTLALSEYFMVSQNNAKCTHGLCVRGFLLVPCLSCCSCANSRSIHSLAKQRQHIANLVCSACYSPLLGQCIPLTSHMYSSLFSILQVKFIGLPSSLDHLADFELRCKQLSRQLLCPTGEIQHSTLGASSLQLLSCMLFTHMI